MGGIPRIIAEPLDVEVFRPFGAKSLAECCLIVPAPAIANAVYNAVGVRVRELPITPEKVLTGLGKLLPELREEVQSAAIADSSQVKTSLTSSTPSLVPGAVSCSVRRPRSSADKISFSSV